MGGGSVDSCSRWTLPAPGFPLQRLMRNPYAAVEKCSVSFTFSHFGPTSRSWLSSANHNVKLSASLEADYRRFYATAILFSLKFLLWGGVTVSWPTDQLAFFNYVNRVEWWKVQEPRKEAVSRTIHSLNKALLSTKHSGNIYCRSEPLCWGHRATQLPAVWGRKRSQQGDTMLHDEKAREAGSATGACKIGTWSWPRVKNYVLSGDFWAEIWGPRKVVKLKE